MLTSRAKLLFSPGQKGVVVLPPETKGPLLSREVTPPGTKRGKFAFRVLPCEIPLLVSGRNTTRD
jgi:hypothetical protein